MLVRLSFSRCGFGVGFIVFWEPKIDLIIVECLGTVCFEGLSASGAGLKDTTLDSLIVLLLWQGL